jgi:uncharacterized protein (DUF58 family)
MRRAGGLLLGAGVLAVVAGAVASLALFALAIGLVVVTEAAGVSVLLAARRVVVTRLVPQREAREDQAIGVGFQVRGLGRLPLPVRVEAQVDADDWVPLGERGGTLQLTVGRCGAWQLAPSRLRPAAPGCRSGGWPHRRLAWRWWWSTAPTPGTPAQWTGPPGCDPVRAGRRSAGGGGRRGQGRLG